MAYWYCARCDKGKSPTVGEKKHFENGCPRCHSEDVFEDEHLRCASCEHAFDHDSFPGLQETDRCPNCDRPDLEKKPPRPVTWPPAQY